MADYYKRCPDCDGYGEVEMLRVHGNPEVFPCGMCVNGLVPLPSSALVIEDPDKEDRTWYCERFGAAGYEPSICADYKHRENGYDCGVRLLVKPAAVGKER